MCLNRIKRKTRIKKQNNGFTKIHKTKLFLKITKRPSKLECNLDYRMSNQLWKKYKQKIRANINLKFQTVRTSLRKSQMIGATL